MEFLKPNNIKIFITFIFIILVTLGYFGVPLFSSDVRVGDTFMPEPLSITLFQPLEFLSQTLRREVFYDAHLGSILLILGLIYYYLLSCVIVRLWNTRIIKKSKILWYKLKSWQKGGLVGLAITIFIFSSSFTPVLICGGIFELSESLGKALCLEFKLYITIPFLTVILSSLIGLFVEKLKKKNENN